MTTKGGSTTIIIRIHNNRPILISLAECRVIVTSPYYSTRLVTFRVHYMIIFRLLVLKSIIQLVLKDAQSTGSVKRRRYSIIIEHPSFTTRTGNTK